MMENKTDSVRKILTYYFHGDKVAIDTCLNILWIESVTGKLALTGYQPIPRIGNKKLIDLIYQLKV